MQHHILLLIFGLLIWTPSMESSKILVYSPTLGHSHIQFTGQLADILVQAGHDVVVLVVSMDEKTQENGTKLARVIPWNGYKYSFSMSNATSGSWKTSGIFATLKLTMSAARAMILSCEAQLMDNELINRLKSENFDLGLCEALFYCGHALFTKIGLNNYVTTLATGPLEILTDVLGVNSNPSFVPVSFSKFTDVMSYRERFINLLSYATLYAVAQLILYPGQRRFEKRVSTNFCVIEALSKSSYLFTNADELLEYPRLLSPKVIHIGGIAVKKPKPLTKDYERLMREATNGAVLVSFGSIARSSLMSVKLKKAFRNAFRDFPKITFIWKYEDDDDIAADLANVITQKWLPQNDLLGHPSMLAFISHCGLNSLTESVHAGVPLICLPLFGDQLKNAKIMEKKGIGIALDKHTVNEQAIYDALLSILYNDTFRETSRRLARMIRGKPIAARELFLRHVNYAIKFGPIENFDVAGTRLNFIQYYMLDIIIPFIILILTLVFVILRCFMIFIRKMFGIAKKKID